MAQVDLERLLLARDRFDAATRPLATLLADSIETDTFRRGLTATDAHAGLVSDAASAAREIVDILEPTAMGGVSRDATRAVDLLEGIGWNRLDDLFATTDATDPGDILRYQFVRHAETMTQFADLAVQKAARAAAADLRHAAA